MQSICDNWQLILTCITHYVVNAVWHVLTFPFYAYCVLAHNTGNRIVSQPGWDRPGLKICRENGPGRSWKAIGCAAEFPPVHGSNTYWTFWVLMHGAVKIVLLLGKCRSEDWSDTRDKYPYISWQACTHYGWSTELPGLYLTAYCTLEISLLTN